MALDLGKFELKRERKIGEFSGRLMSDSKWTKLFKTLSSICVKTTLCKLTDIYDGNSNVIELPTTDEFDSVFDGNGIKDVLQGGPLLFKEIKWIEFPVYYPNKAYNENIDQIEIEINKIGRFEIERDQNALKIYGYK